MQDSVARNIISMETRFKKNQKILKNYLKKNKIRPF